MNLLMYYTFTCRCGDLFRHFGEICSYLMGAKAFGFELFSGTKYFERRRAFKRAMDM